jgi:HSP20 family protein
MSYKKTIIAFIIVFIISTEAFLFFDVNGDYKKIALRAFLIACTITILRSLLLNWYRRTFVKQYKYNINSISPSKQKQYKLFADVTNIGNPKPVPVNIKNVDSGYEMHLIAPGLYREGFKVDITGLLLTISYNENILSKKLDNWLKCEYILHSFTRSFTLDDVIDGTKASAVYKDGILQVMLPKKEFFDTSAKNIEVK